VVKLESFRKPDGKIDYEAHRKAQLAAGEVCFKCGDHIIKLFGEDRLSSGPRMCASCHELATSAEAVSHDSQVRCPHCEHIFRVDAEDDVYTDGINEIFCPDCCEKFDIETHVSFSFTSPALAEKKEAKTE